MQRAYVDGRRCHYSGFRKSLGGNKARREGNRHCVSAVKELDLYGQRGYDERLSFRVVIPAEAAANGALLRLFNGMVNNLHRYAVCVAATVAILIVPHAFAQNGGPPSPPPALVQIDTARETEMAPTVWAPGTLVSRDDARVAAEVDGRLVAVAEIGTRVAAGESLARIDATELNIERTEAEAVVLRERARTEFAEQEWNRLKGLAEKGLVTKNRLDQAYSALNASRGESRVASARLNLVQDRLARTVIRAPFAGVVANRYHRVGERVDEGDEVLRLVSPDSLEVQVFIPPATLPHVTLGTAVTVASNPAERVATVRSLVPIGDDRSRLYEVRLSLPESTNWPAGTSVRVAVPTATPKTVTAVPRDALVLRQEGVLVYRLSADDTAESVPVETGVASGPWIEVTGAIRPGDRVIVRGGERIRPGQPVTIMEPIGPSS